MLTFKLCAFFLWPVTWLTQVCKTFHDRIITKKCLKHLKCKFEVEVFFCLIFSQGYNADATEDRFGNLIFWQDFPDFWHLSFFNTFNLIKVKAIFTFFSWLCRFWQVYNSFQHRKKLFGWRKVLPRLPKIATLQVIFLCLGGGDILNFFFKVNRFMLRG